MRKVNLFWQLFPSFIAIVVITLIAVEWYAEKLVSDIYIDRTKRELETGVSLLAQQLKENPKLSPADVDMICDKYGAASGQRYTVILPSGVVIGDSEKDSETMDNHADRPEIIQAFKGKVGYAKRYSQTLQQWMIYLATPIVPGDEKAPVVRTSVSLADIHDAMTSLHSQSIRAGVIIALAAGLLSIFLARRISRPLQDLKKGAEAFGAGNFDKKLPSSPVAEIEILGNTMNKMAQQLNERISTITSQRDEQNSLLFCMMEGVIAIDLNRHVIRMNRSARELFGVEEEGFKGKIIEEIVRNTDLHEIVTDTLSSSELIEGDIFLADSDKYLLAHGTVLHNSAGQKIGALIVLNDITRLRKLERMRKDFVANVSHELKTPITSIKGFSETLLDGAAENKEDRDRFLAIINKQAGRLQSIVEDLLTLSSIEHDADKDEIERQKGNIENVVENAIQACRSKANKKDITIEFEKTGDLRANMNVQLLEQALNNLIDNAIKYSEPNTKVIVSGKEDDASVSVSVTDQGPGITKKHLSRLFERFYRVDKSRSRNLGGTGLGLAIVKRIALAHKGRVEVDSEVGKGSTFTIILPKAS